MEKTEEIKTRKTVAFFRKRDSPYGVDVDKVILSILPGTTLVFRCLKKEEYKYNKEGIENRLHPPTLRLMDIDIARVLFSFEELGQTEAPCGISKSRAKIEFSGKMDEVDNAEWIYVRYHKGRPYIHRTFTLGQQYPNRGKGEAIFSRTELLERFIIVYK